MQLSRLIRVMITALLLTASSGIFVAAIADEKQTSVEVAWQVKEQIGIYPAEFLTTYVDAIGRRLVTGLESTTSSFRFKVTDQNEPHAFAAPNGYIYVSRGLLALINTEDELAGILAHEIIHVTQNHHVRQAQSDSSSGILTWPGAAIGEVVSEDIDKTIHTPIEVAGKAYISSYGRTQENEADRLGMQLAARAGYDPAALATVLYNLERTVTLLADVHPESGYFDNHPSTPTRITDIEQEAASISWTPARPFARDKEALLDRLNGLTWGADNPMQGILRGRQFMQPDMDFSVTFPDGWDAVNTPIFVGAFAPEQQALVILGSAEKPGPVTEIAAAFIEELRTQADIVPTEAHPVELEAGPAYLVRIEDASGEQPVSIYYLWINTRNTTFRFIAMGADSFRDQLRDTVLSLRNMTAEEKTSIVDNRIRIVTANAGETILELSMRTGNQFPAELTAAVNGLPYTVTLEQDQLVKILRKEAYFH